MTSSGTAWTPQTGKILWTVDLPGTEDSTYAYGFSDSTTPSPVTDGKHVWFFNCSGSVGCWDYDGQAGLAARVEADGRTARSTSSSSRCWLATRSSTWSRATRTIPSASRKTPGTICAAWTKTPAKPLWVSEDALTHYNTPVLGTLADGTPAILQGRGGYHDVPETPNGLTLTSLAPGQEGKALWRYEAKGKALYNMHWDKQYAYWFDLDTSRTLR